MTRTKLFQLLLHWQFWEEAYMNPKKGLAWRTFASICCCTEPFSPAMGMQILRSISSNPEAHTMQWLLCCRLVLHLRFSPTNWKVLWVALLGFLYHQFSVRHISIKNCRLLMQNIAWTQPMTSGDSGLFYFWMQTLIIPTTGPLAVPSPCRIQHCQGICTRRWKRSMLLCTSQKECLWQYSGSKARKS